jgi:hypothetical protein
MNTDDELLTATRESFARAHLTTPLDATIRRGRQLRGRRRIAGIAGAIVIVAGSVLTAAALLPGGAAGTAPLPSGPVRFHTTAWTVAKGPDRTVTVLVRQLSDPAGLQRALRADGVPAAVAFQGGVLSDTPPLPRSCRNTGLTPEADAHLQSLILGAPGNPAAHVMVALTIHAAEIPKGIGLNLTVQSSTNSYGWSLGLVRATPACTGS